MKNYLNMKNPPRFSGEWKKFAFYIIDLILMGVMIYGTKIVNGLLGIPLWFAILHYVLTSIIVVLALWRPSNNPDKRQIFIVFESLFYSDNNYYHVLDPNRQYHGKTKS